MQIASFSNYLNAVRVQNRLREAGFSPSIEKTVTGLHRVILEHIPQEELDQVKERLAQLGFPHPLVRN
ncbi:MAG: SPOR domain-containing protein [Spirochaetales bacterium]